MMIIEVKYVPSFVKFPLELPGMEQMDGWMDG
jgi:hypothetical protein